MAGLSKPPPGTPIQRMIGSEDFLALAPVGGLVSKEKVWVKIGKAIQDLERFKKADVRLSDPAFSIADKQMRQQENLARQMGALFNMERLIYQYFGYVDYEMYKEREPEEHTLLALLDDIEDSWEELVREKGNIPFPSNQMRGFGADTPELMDIKKQINPEELLSSHMTLTIGENACSPEKARSFLWRILMTETGTELLIKLKSELGRARKSIDLHFVPGTVPYFPWGATALEYNGRRRQGTIPCNFSYMGKDSRFALKKQGAMRGMTQYSPHPFYPLLTGQLGEALACLTAPGLTDYITRYASDTYTNMRDELGIPAPGKNASIVANPLTEIPLRPKRKLTDKAEEAFFVIDQESESDMTPWTIGQKEAPAMEWDGPGWLKPPTDTSGKADWRVFFAEPESDLALADVYHAGKPRHGSYGRVHFIPCGPHQAAVKLLVDFRFDREPEKEIFAAGLVRMLGRNVTAPRGRLLESDSPEVETLYGKVRGGIKGFAGLPQEQMAPDMVMTEQSLKDMELSFDSSRFQRHQFIAIHWDLCPGKTPNQIGTVIKESMNKDPHDPQLDSRRIHPEMFKHEYHTPLLQDRHYMEALGELYLLDIVIGNFDRFGAFYHASNMLYDTDTHFIHGIDQNVGYLNTNRMLNFLLYEGDDRKPKGLKLTGYSLSDAKAILNKPVPDEKAVAEFCSKMESIMRKLLSKFIQDFLKAPTEPTYLIERFWRLDGVRGASTPDCASFQYGFAKALFNLTGKAGMLESMARFKFKNIQNEAEFVLRMIRLAIGLASLPPVEKTCQALEKARLYAASKPESKITEHPLFVGSSGATASPSK
ncbi:hypothetical protein FUAX_44420 (plasmid) [Fulvitalea axinellae]|uniref:Uncharacterized protein n=2 Tax=Fulvitalea axinellae TaxID=1182444 RepID=A0AAU9DLF8_9BACT|nr:hypothetical protein FUAX_44420 [Fulvitalea axinellae]